MHARLLPLIVRLFDFFTIAFSALFPLLNPFGSAMLFLGLVGPADAIVYRRLARRVALYTVLFLMVVDLAGALVLTFFGISLPVIQVAGGLVLASMGWTLLNQPDAPDTAEASGTSSSLEELDSKVFYPFTFPLTAGPGSVVVTLTLAAHAEQPTTIDSIFSQLGLFLAVVVLCGMIYFAYGYAPALARKVSRQTIHGILRIISFILFAIGVQIFWRGAEVLLREALRIHS
ncbi:MAG: MarC family protein [Acidobacteriaceae bacterium]|jgi:multiple antibiotic resistance protein